MKTQDPRFEQLWQENKSRLLMEDEEYKSAISSYTMTSGADWLLFGIPVVAGIVSIEFIPISHEILRWIASILITIVVFAICVYVKSLNNPHRAVGDIESDIKKRAYEHYQKTGELPRQKSPQP